MNRLVYLLTILITAVAPRVSAAEFSNLDFEEADPALREKDQGPFGTSGPTLSRIPHWTFWIGNKQQATVGFNLATVDGPSTSLHDRRTFGPEFNRYPSPPFQGSFGFIFKSQAASADEVPSLKQSATIPPQSRTITIHVFGDPIRVFINDQPIALSYQLIQGSPSTPPYLPMTLAFGDVSAFAGKPVSLRIAPDTENSSRTFTGIDQIAFTKNVMIKSDQVLVDEGDPIVLLRLK